MDSASSSLSSSATFFSGDPTFWAAVCLVLVILLLVLSGLTLVLLMKLPAKSEEVAQASREAWRRDLGDAVSQSRQLIASGIKPEFVSTQLEIERAMQENNRGSREETSAALNQMRENISRSLEGSTRQIQSFTSEQNRRVEALTATLNTSISELRQRVDDNLKAMNADNQAQLEKIRETVEEKLQTTLTNKVGESFSQVTQQLNQVYQGLGEMKELAADVGGLKRVLVNVKSRGMLGEVQLEALLSEYFTPTQYVKNAHPLPSQPSKVVEFAVKLPGVGAKECLLPIDSKFPVEDYQRLQDAAEAGDRLLVKKAKDQLKARLRDEAKEVAQYINPPETTDFAILFIPSEGLYAEALALEGLTHDLYSHYRVYMMGPSTLASALCAYRAGFQTLAIEKKSSEIRQILASVQVEFKKFDEVLSKLKGQAEGVVRTVEQVETRSRQMNRRLANVSEDEKTEALPNVPSSQILD